MEEVAPLSGKFMLASIIGLTISAIKIYPMNKTWGFAMILLFAIMLISSFVSMARAPADALIEVDK